MTSTFVLDASMTMAWHFADEETAATLAIEDRLDTERAIVPAHWFAEVANSLAMGERSGRASPAETARFIDRLSGIDIEVDQIAPDRHWTHILPLARAHRLTVYDTLYLELAERRGLPLASLDKALCNAARHVGVPVITDSL